MASYLELEAVEQTSELDDVDIEDQKLQARLDALNAKSNPAPKVNVQIPQSIFVKTFQKYLDSLQFCDLDLKILSAYDSSTNPKTELWFLEHGDQKTYSPEGCDEILKGKISIEKKLAKEIATLDLTRTKLLRLFKLARDYDYREQVYEALRQGKDKIDFEAKKAMKELEKSEKAKLKLMKEGHKIRRDQDVFDYQAETVKSMVKMNEKEAAKIDAQKKEQEEYEARIKEEAVEKSKKRKASDEKPKKNVHWRLNPFARS